MPLFNEIVKDVWHQKHANHEALIARATETIISLETREQKLIDLFVEGHIDKETYDSQRKKVGTALETARNQQSEVLMSAAQLNDLLDFAEWMLQRVAGIWESATLANQLRLQEALFSEGLRVSQEGFGTPLRPLFFLQFLRRNQKWRPQGDSNGQASRLGKMWPC